MKKSGVLIAHKGAKQSVGDIIYQLIIKRAKDFKTFHPLCF